MDIKQQNILLFKNVARHYDFWLLKRWRANAQKEMLKSISIKKNAKILDAGCGTGNLLSLLQRAKKGKNLKLHGIDASKEMLDAARKKLKRNTKLSLQAVEDIGFKSNFFDYVFSTDAFHHYASHDAAMKNFHRVLKKGGFLIVLDVDFGGFFNYLLSKIEPGNSGVRSMHEFMRYCQLIMG